MNWKKLFATHILERGYDYYLENTVENIDISADIIRADVIGSEDYEVEISVNNGEVTERKKKCIHSWWMTWRKKKNCFSVSIIQLTSR